MAMYLWFVGFSRNCREHLRPEIGQVCKYRARGAGRGAWGPGGTEVLRLAPRAYAPTAAFFRRIPAEMSVITRPTGKISRNVIPMFTSGFL